MLGEVEDTSLCHTCLEHTKSEIGEVRLRKSVVSFELQWLCIKVCVSREAVYKLIQILFGSSLLKICHN